MTAGTETGLLSRAAAWRLAGRLFERPVPGYEEAIAALAPEAEDETLAAAAREVLECADEGTFLARLGPGGAVSPREAAFAGFGDPGRILADAEGFYAAFGYAPRAEDPADHAAVETGFVAFLFLKEAFALASGRREEAGTCEEARRRFLEEHVSTWAAPLARGLEAAGDVGRARAARWIAERAGEAPRASLPVLPPEEGSTFDCC